MGYGTDNDPYHDPKTGVLKNLLGITSAGELEQAAADITATAIALLVEDPVPGEFDLNHLKVIHKRLFSALYPWAGTLRTVELQKGQTRFASADFLEQAAENIFDQLRHERGHFLTRFCDVSSR